MAGCNMDIEDVKVLGTTQIDRVLNTMSATRIISFPDGIDRSFTLLARQWFIFDAWQLMQEDSTMIATGAYEIAKQLALDFDRDPKFFEYDLRGAFEDIIREGASCVEMPGNVEGGNDNSPI